MTVHKKHIVPTEGEKLKFEIKDNMVDVTIWDSLSAKTSIL